MNKLSHIYTYTGAKNTMKEIMLPKNNNQLDNYNEEYGRKLRKMKRVVTKKTKCKNSRVMSIE